jgi:membrane protein
MAVDNAGEPVRGPVWVAMSALFSWYVANFGHYDKTYGSLGAIVGFLTWIWLSLMVVMLGAELNSSIEAQAQGQRARRRDGAAKPLSSD